MNIDKRPVKNAGVTFCRHRQDSHLRVAGQQKSAQARPAFSILEIGNQEIRPSSLYQVRDVGFFVGFADHFDVRLLGNRRQNELSHQTWPICYHHSDFLHALLLVRKCAAGRNKMKGSKTVQQCSSKKVQSRLGSDLRKIDRKDYGVSKARRSLLSYKELFTFL